MTDGPSIDSQQPTQAPAWAVLERQLIRAMDQAAPVFLDKYTRPGGQLIWREDYPGDGVWADDLYEAFFNWPLYYALGGSRYIGEMAVQEWNAITRQLTHDYGRVTDEFVNDDDWFHNSENYIYFYHLGLAEPTSAETVGRARRFADLYLGEAGGAANYDPVHRLVRSPFNGSKGPLFHARFDDVRYNLEYGHTTLGPGFDYPADWHQDPGWRERVHARFDQVVMNGDVPVNLGIVGLVTCAFLHTGDERYRRWVIEYVEAWLARIAANGGIVPDNIGPTGQIGEQRGGQWWGGFYGWTGLYSLHMMGSALMGAAECAQLLTGDDRHLSLIRSQLDVVMTRGREVDGRWLVPFKHTDAGWTEFQPLLTQDPIRLWTASMASADYERLERLRRGCEDEWRTVTARGPRVLDDRAWTRYLAGEVPDYPERILQANYAEVLRRAAAVQADQQDLRQLDVHHWQQVNPVLTEALVHLTTGAPQAIYWGGLSRGRVRYFDPEDQRPGLPDDVAALVTGLTADQVSLTLVNLHPTQSRAVIVGAGTFGEHQFLTARAHDQTRQVDGRYLTVRLQPGTQIELDLGMRRHGNTPSYAWPWSGSSQVR